MSMPQATPAPFKNRLATGLKNTLNTGILRYLGEEALRAFIKPDKPELFAVTLISHYLLGDKIRSFMDEQLATRAAAIFGVDFTKANKLQKNAIRMITAVGLQAFADWVKEKFEDDYAIDVITAGVVSPYALTALVESL